MIRSLIGVLAGVLLAATSLVAFAQDKEAVQQEKLQKNYEMKVAESWFKDNGFTDDYDTAKKKSAESGKPIFAYFTRSYAG